MKDNDFEGYLERRAKAINKKLEESLTKNSSDTYITALLGRSGYKYDNKALNKSIFEPAWYLLGLGGKRWRPVLMCLVMEALGKKSENYLEFCLIPEVIHNATLVHDDIEDGSKTRRGAPAAYIKYGLDVATNFGTFLYYFPIVALIDSKKLSTEKKNKAMAIYIREMLRVSVGQATDIAWHRFLVDPFKITEQNYMQMVYDKSGVLARMAAKLGATMADADEKTVELLGKFGGTIGVAFQIQDDLLNIYPSSVSKTKGGVGEDISEGKISLPVIYALQHSGTKEKTRLLKILKMHTNNQRLRNEAIRIIDSSGARDYCKSVEQKIIREAWNEVDKRLPTSEAKYRLKQMADFLISRSK